MNAQEELEMHPLPAGVYRRLWLDSEDQLGLIAECLAEALGWQSTPDQPLPDALELAEVAAERIRDTQAQAVGIHPRHRSSRRARHLNQFVLN